MNKGLQIFLLILLFGACAAGGYFAGGAILNKPVAEESTIVEVVPEVEAEPVVEEAVPVAIPIIDSVSALKRNANNTYNFSVEAHCDSDEAIVFVLRKSATSSDSVQSSVDGNFTNVPSSSNGKYYLVACTANSGVESEAREIGGFNNVVMYEKITVNEIEHLVNVVKDWENGAPADYYKRVSNLHVDVVNPKEDVMPYTTISDLTMAAGNDDFQSISVIGTPRYDEQNRMTYIKIQINY